MAMTQAEANRAGQAMDYMLQHNANAAFSVIEEMLDARSEAPPVEAWVCTQPADGVPYRVLADRWVENYTVRLILKVETVLPNAEASRDLA